MLKVIVIKNYKDHKAGDILNVSCNVAHGLFEIGVAKKYEKEVLQRTEFGKTKSFKKSPSSFRIKK